jgi:hypothetical protein
MSLRSPIAAMLWETWRVTRVEAALKLVFGSMAALAVLAISSAIATAGDGKDSEAIMDFGAAVAMTLLVVPHMVSWQSLARLNGGRAGFSLYRLFFRPVSTPAIVGVPMAYLTALSAAIYLVSALVLRATSGFAFPLLPVAAWIAGITVVFLAATWSTRNKTVQILAMMFVAVKAWGLAVDRLTAVEIPDTFDWPPRLWPTLFDFPTSDYVVIALIAIASFGITLAGVMRQRRGEGWAETPFAQRGGVWTWLVDLFRVRCPTSSATRAQVWYELKSHGLPLMAIGFALAIVIVLLSAVSGPVDAAINADPGTSCPAQECFYARAMPPLLAPFSLLVVLFLGGNAFGIRRRQGRTHVTGFEATQPHGTARLALIKVLVKSGCVLVAILAIGVSAWISLPLLGDAVFVQMWSVPLSSRLPAAIGAGFAALSGYEQIALAIVAAVGLVTCVAICAVLAALWARYTRRANIAICVLLLCGIALVPLAMAEGQGMISFAAFQAIIAAERWTLIAVIVVTMAYVSWRGFAERVLNMRYAIAAVVISTAFGVAWLTMRHGASPPNAVSLLWAMVLPLLASVVAPWSLSRLRHT